MRRTRSSLKPTKGPRTPDPSLPCTAIDLGSEEMASAEAKPVRQRWFGYPPLSAMGDGQRREFQEALLDAAGGSVGRSG